MVAQLPTDNGYANGRPPSGGGLFQAPGPARGILRRLRQAVGGWLGPRLSQGTRVAQSLTSEKAAAGPRLTTLPWFLPYYDDATGETPAIRAAYRKMWADPNVKAAVLGKILNVASTDLKFVPASQTSAKDQQVAKFAQWQFTKRVQDGFAGLAWAVLSGMLTDGYSVSEKVWLRQDRGQFAGNYVLSALKPKMAGDDLALLTDEYRNVVGVQGLRFNAGEVFSPDDFVIARYLPLYDVPTGMSDFRAVYSRYWLLDTSLKLRAIGLEKRALPLLKGTYKDVSQQSALESVLARAKSQNYIAVPDGAMVEALDIAGQADKIFADTIRDLKEDIFLGIAGATLQQLTGDKGQQRGDSEVQKDTAQLFIWYLYQLVLSVLNDEDNGLIKDVVDLNYVVGEYPVATLSAVDVQEMAAESQIDDRLHAWGVDLSKKELYQRYGRTPPADEADKIPGAQQGQPAAGAGGTSGGGGLPGFGEVWGPEPGREQSQRVEDLAEDGEASAGQPFHFSEEWRHYLEQD